MVTRKRKRYEEARALKTGKIGRAEDAGEPCAECGAKPGAPHASWCEAPFDDEDEELEDDGDA